MARAQPRIRGASRPFASSSFTASVLDGFRRDGSPDFATLHHNLAHRFGCGMFYSDREIALHQALYSFAGCAVGDSALETYRDPAGFVRRLDITPAEPRSSWPRTRARRGR